MSIRSLKARLEKVKSKMFGLAIFIIDYDEIEIFNKVESGEIKSYTLKRGDFITKQLLESYDSFITIIDPMNGRRKVK